MYLGIDIGTQSLKAVIADAALVVRGTGQAPYVPSYPRPGWAEQHPSLWLEALRPAITQALDAAGLRPADIRALAVSGQLDGCIGITRDCEPIGSAIIWMDRRASAQLADVDPAMIRERAGLVPDPTHMAPKISWGRQYLPRAREVVAWHQPVSFMVEVLTGARVMDHSLASTTMVYNLANEDWDAALTEAFGIDPATLPELRSAGAIAGELGIRGAELTGLPEGLPVAVGTGDDFASPLGCGIVSPGTVAVTLGTAEAISALSPSLVIDPQMLVETHAYPAAGHYHLGNPGWLSGGAVTWFLSTFSVANAVAFSSLASEAPPGSDGVLFLPTLSGAFAPRWAAAARGAFYGMTPAHGKAHFARAVLEGTSFAMRDVIERLRALGVGADHVHLMGGGAASGPWAQIRADLMQMPVEILEARDTTAMGAVVLALTAAGEAPSVAEAAARLKLPRKVVDPIAENGAIYAEAYGRYRKLFDSLEPMFV
jgi:xylulokinase